MEFPQAQFVFVVSGKMLISKRIHRDQSRHRPHNPIRLGLAELNFTFMTEFAPVPLEEFTGWWIGVSIPGA